MSGALSCRSWIHRGPPRAAVCWMTAEGISVEYALPMCRRCLRSLLVGRGPRRCRCLVCYENGVPRMYIDDGVHITIYRGVPGYRWAGTNEEYYRKARPWSHLLHGAQVERVEAR